MSCPLTIVNHENHPCDSFGSQPDWERFAVWCSWTCCFGLSSSLHTFRM